MSVTMTVEQELTDEGKKMWDNIEAYEALMNGKSVLPKEKMKKLKLNFFEMEVYFMRVELRRMIKNSTQVIQDCDMILMKISTMEDYMKSDAKIAKQLHLNLIKRLQNILDSKSAFDKPVWVDDEPKRPYDKS